MNQISCFIILLFLVGVNGCEICIEPSHPEAIVEGEKLFITVWFNLNSSFPDWLPRESLQLTIETRKGYVDLSNTSLVFSNDSPNRTKNITILIQATDFGHELLTFKVSPVYNDSHFRNHHNSTLTVLYPLRLVRLENALDFIFLIFVGLFVLVTNVSMGCLLDFEIIKTVFKRPVGPLVGFFSQFLFMPLASFGMAFAMLKEPSLRLGLFALGCSPGGTGSNFWTYLFGGDLNLSVVMTFISTLAAVGMMPLWLYTLGQYFLEEGDMKLPYDHLFISLGSFVLPVGIGILVKRFRPKWAEWAKKLARPLIIIFLLYMLTVGFYTNRFMFRFITWQIVVAGLVVAWGGYIFGALLASVFCMEKRQIIAISIETALQNPGIAFFLLKVSLRQPDADIASAAPVAQLLVTGLPLWITYLTYIIRRKIKKRHSREEKPSIDQNLQTIRIPNEQSENTEKLMNLKNLEMVNKREINGENEQEKKIPENEILLEKNGM